MGHLHVLPKVLVHFAETDDFMKGWQRVEHCFPRFFIREVGSEEYRIQDSLESLCRRCT